MKLPSLLPWTAEIDGEDLVVRNVIATCFGGAYDKGDNGQTESGIMNDGSDPDLFGVALPIRSIEKATANSPLAFRGRHIPWKTPVMVWPDAEGENAAKRAILIDNGPNTLKYPTHALDCNPPLAMLFNTDPRITLENVANEWERHGMSFRIIGGSKWVS